jgi:hypothetical protein
MSMDNFETENIKLKELLNQRNQECESLNMKVSKQKNHYEESINILRR